MDTKHSDTKEHISRREAIRKIGIAATGAALGIGGAGAFGLSRNSYRERPMKVLLVNGSPHKEGCTHTALEEVAGALREGGVETEFFWIGRKPLSGCIGCGNCSGSGRCFIKDSVNEFLEKETSFDGFVFGCPVHFSAMNGAMTSFMNRAFFCARTTNAMAGKPAAGVTSCRRSGSLPTLDQLNRYFIHRGMPAVPSQYWPMVFGNTPDEVRQDAEGLQIMRTLGRNMTWMLHNMEAGRQAEITRPIPEPRISTNFIR